MVICGRKENMDKYTKFILTIIAVALFGINYHLFSGDIISKAEANHMIEASHSVGSHNHSTDEISDFVHSVERVVGGCKAINIMTKGYYQLHGIEKLSLVIRC